MHLEEFAEGDSALHRLDPRVKFLCAMPLMALTATAGGLRAPLLSLLVAASLSVAARLDALKLFKRLAAVNAFVLMLWVFLPFSYPGTEAFALGPFRATEEGVLRTLSISLKTNAIVLMTIAVFGTSGAMDLAHALVHLRAPRKLVYLFFFFYRYVSVLHEEYLRLLRAMRIRCFRPATGAHAYRAHAWLLGMLLVRSYERSGRVYKAMLCRGFHGHFPLISHFHLHRRDIVFAALMALIAGVLAAMRI